VLWPESTFSGLRNVLSGLRNVPVELRNASFDLRDARFDLGNAGLGPRKTGLCVRVTRSSPRSTRLSPRDALFRPESRLFVLLLPFPMTRDARRREHLVLDVGHPEADVADLEVVQMGVLPPEDDLQCLVEHAERDVGGDTQRAPDRGFDVAERDPKIEDVVESMALSAAVQPWSPDERTAARAASTSSRTVPAAGNGRLACMYQ
jgi:hypothetical protein